MYIGIIKKNKVRQLTIKSLDKLIVPVNYRHGSLTEETSVYILYLKDIVIFEARTCLFNILKKNHASSVASALSGSRKIAERKKLKSSCRHLVTRQSYVSFDQIDINFEHEWDLNAQTIFIINQFQSRHSPVLCKFFNYLNKCT